MKVNYKTALAFQYSLTWPFLKSRFRSTTKNVTFSAS